MENSVLPVGKEISDVVSLKINGKVEGIYSGNVIHTLYSKMVFDSTLRKEKLLLSESDFR